MKAEIAQEKARSSQIGLIDQKEVNHELFLKIKEL